MSDSYSSSSGSSDGGTEQGERPEDNPPDYKETGPDQRPVGEATSSNDRWDERVRQQRSSEIGPIHRPGSPRVPTSNQVPAGKPAKQDVGPVHHQGDTRSLHEVLPPVEVDTLLDSLEEGILLMDGNLRIVAVNEPVLEDTGATEGELLGLPLEKVLEVDNEDIERIRSFNAGPETGDTRLTIRDGAIKAGETDRLRADFHCIPRRPFSRTDGLVMTYCCSSSPRGELSDTRLKERLGLVNQFNTTLRRVSRSIIHPTSRTDLEAIVCSELAKGSPYEFAVIVEETTDGDEPEAVPRTWAGIDDADLTELLSPIDTERDSQCPLTKAIKTGAVQVATGIDRHPKVAEKLAETGLSIASVAVVPIRYKERDYGVLAVYSGRETPFEEYELGMLEDLGEIVGFAYNAVEKDELLGTDSVVELEIEVTDSEAFLVGASALTECTFTLESVVPVGDGTLLYYHRVEGGSMERLLDVAAESPQITGAEVIRRHEDLSWVVFERKETSPIELLSANNVNVREVRATGGVVRYLLEISPTRDIEGVFDVLASLYGEYELVAKRRRERAAYTTSEFRHEVLDSLTTKQQKTLEAAFQQGYFNRPRDSTAEEIASQLDIASSTFHQHLRAAMSKLMTILLDSESNQPVLTQ